MNCVVITSFPSRDVSQPSDALFRKRVGFNMTVYVGVMVSLRISHYQTTLLVKKMYIDYQPAKNRFKIEPYNHSRNPKNVMKKVMLFSLIYLVSYYCFSQENVEGYIVDQNGAAIPGANILIMGTPIGTASDMNGHFKLQLEGGSHKLMFAYLKYKTLEQDISIDATQKYTLVVKLIRDVGKNRKLQSSCKIQVKNFKT